MQRRFLPLALLLASFFLTSFSPARAFCGFYVAKAASGAQAAAA